jgi:hypothetical protein
MSFRLDTLRNAPVRSPLFRSWHPNIPRRSEPGISIPELKKNRSRIEATAIPPPVHDHGSPLNKPISFLDEPPPLLHKLAVFHQPLPSGSHPLAVVNVLLARSFIVSDIIIQRRFLIIHRRINKRNTVTPILLSIASASRIISSGRHRHPPATNKPRTAPPEGIPLLNPLALAPNSRNSGRLDSVRRLDPVASLW